MRLDNGALRERAFWEKAGIALPRYDRERMREETLRSPRWIHFGAGNLFRGFIAELMQRLLEKGSVTDGILAVKTRDRASAGAMEENDALTLLVRLLPDGGTRMEVIASVAAVWYAGEKWEALRAAFRSPVLQMVSFTITEKGYALRDARGEWLPEAGQDAERGPAKPHHAMGIAAALLLSRFEAGGAPVAMVSFDNCTPNGERLRAGVLDMARAWKERGFVGEDFLGYLEDETRVSFPWSMIDKITPQPSADIARRLEALGLEGMMPESASSAPFVNAEAPQYLVLEDRFPNGCPPFEEAGVYLTSREEVQRAERMKVAVCLNPLHTALAIYGCLLGFRSIAAEMRDGDLRALVERLGYDEGMPTLEGSGVLNPADFLREVLTERFPNAFIPDTPQRIAADTSQKMPVRFGGTLRAYCTRPDLDLSRLTAVPLVIAGWLRYLLGVDDEGNPMPLSPDPLLEDLRQRLAGVRLGGSVPAETLRPVLSDAALFGVDLTETVLAERIREMLAMMLTGPGAVRRTLRHYLASGAKASGQVRQ